MKNLVRINKNTFKSQKQVIKVPKGDNFMLINLSQNRITFSRKISYLLEFKKQQKIYFAHIKGSSDIYLFLTQSKNGFRLFQNNSDKRFRFNNKKLVQFFIDFYNLSTNNKNYYFDISLVKSENKGYLLKLKP